MKIKKAPKFSNLKRYYRYDENTGNFYYRSNGKLAGFERQDGYLAIFFEGVSYLGHRLAWYYMTGDWVTEIDHKDTVRNHNWFKNLRSCTRKQNTGNSNGWGKKKKSGLPRGVYFHPADKTRFRAQIFMNYKAVHLGCFDSIEKATAAYREAARQHFGEFACEK